MTSTTAPARRAPRRRLDSAHAVQVVAVVAIVVAMTATTPGFRGSSATFSILENFPLIGLVTLALAVTMIAGELDLSVASMAAFGGVLVIHAAPLGLVGCLVVATLACATVGLVQGYVIARLQISSLVVTTATSILIRGFVWVVSGEGPIQLQDFSMSDVLLRRWWIFSPASAIALVVFILVGVLLSRVRVGREIYAVGGGRTESAAAGVDVRRAVTVVFVVSGACAGLGGALVSVRGASAAPNAFPNLLLLAVAASLIGGISLAGGRGSVLSVVLGVVVVSTVSAGLAAKGSASYWADLVIGVVLIGIVLLQLALSIVGRSVERGSART